MPQMAPMNWLSLYIYFIVLFMFMMILNYYMFSYKPMKSTSSMSKKTTINWKW